jgi:DNA-binding CsgD family transcriptional regulator
MSMADLTANQLRRALTAAGELAEAHDLAEFPTLLAKLLRELIPCEHAGYNAIDVKSEKASVVADPADVVFDGGPEVLAQFASQSPIIVRAAAGDRSVLRLSDHIGRRELHRTDLYNHVYRLVGLEYQLGVQLPPLRSELGHPDEFIGLSLSRSRDDFTEADKQLLGLVSPLCCATAQRLHELALLKAIVESQAGEQESAVVLVDAAGTVAWASAAAQQRLGLPAGQPLPGNLESWLADQRSQRTGACETATFLLEGEAVRPRLVRDAYPGLDSLHLLGATPKPDNDELHGLDLTRRQREVLKLVLDGLTSKQIADRLLISPRTAEKHIDSIYRRLGVRNRSQAIVVAMQAGF